MTGDTRQSGWASWWRVCYQRGLPRLVLTRQSQAEHEPIVEEADLGPGCEDLPDQQELGQGEDTGHQQGGQQEEQLPASRHRATGGLWG